MGYLLGLHETGGRLMGDDGPEVGPLANIHNFSLVNHVCYHVVDKYYTLFLVLLRLELLLVLWLELQMERLAGRGVQVTVVDRLVGCRGG